ncbi:hypothetical protein BBIA_0729 [Bifidobacterium biavatii DSM 23969]|uniref:Uncharacterized protein n=1 Tax=Bifidobacterium biavatii DSM 23969 TaxID=1437608 RepID=A0A086ZZ62_9BIFI|nr:hypothetical protein BBIA_0729 [Bifidobacterium biavatii DSM 23969]
MADNIRRLRVNLCVSKTTTVTLSCLQSDAAQLVGTNQ